MDTAYFFVKERIAARDVIFELCPTKAMIEDKSLTGGDPLRNSKTSYSTMYLNPKDPQDPRSVLRKLKTQH